MSSEHDVVAATPLEAEQNLTTGTAKPLADVLSWETSETMEMIELNNRMRTDFMTQCSVPLQDDEESRECVERVWKKYLRCVGNAAMLAAFFDTLPFHVKKSVLPKYHNLIIQWCTNVFRIHSSALLCSTFYSETFQRVIRYALNQLRPPTNAQQKAIIYVSMDFDPNLITDLTNSISNITFQHIHNDSLHEDMIDLTHLQQAIERDLKESHSYPAIVIANAGTALLGRCDDLSKIKSICDHHHLWLHVIGDLLGSLALLRGTSEEEEEGEEAERVTIHGDSVTLDIMKLFGIQSLPYLTFFVRSSDSRSSSGDEGSLTCHPLYDYILHSPSISFLSVWSMSERCSKEDILSHMKYSFELSNLFFERAQTIKTLRFINIDESVELASSTYQRLCSSKHANQNLPKAILVFRFEPKEIPQVENLDDLYGYIDLLNLWLFDKLSQEYPKMNLELLKSVHFQIGRSDGNANNQVPAHAIRFAPLEHVLDTIEKDEMQAFINILQRYTDILLATLTGRVNLATVAASFGHLRAAPIPNWAGIGGVRYIPDGLEITDFSKLDETTAYQIDSLQAELARKLQTNDSAFSLGGGNDETDPVYYLRLGMIKKPEDLQILLQKISQAGQEVETSLKYVEEMAAKIKMGIEQVQKDLQDENLRALSEAGLLRQLPIVSNLLSWWSPPPANSTVTMKGRSYDLNTGRVESTEETYVHRMQIQRQQQAQPATAETHNDHDTPPVTSTDTDQTTVIQTST